MKLLIVKEHKKTEKDDEGATYIVHASDVLKYKIIDKSTTELIMSYNTTQIFTVYENAEKLVKDIYENSFNDGGDEVFKLIDCTQPMVVPNRSKQKKDDDEEAVESIS